MWLTLFYALFLAPPVVLYVWLRLNPRPYYGVWATRNRDPWRSNSMQAVMVQVSTVL